MNALKNKVQLVGNLGNTPEIIELKGGNKLAKLSIATHDKYKDNNGALIEETQWHNVVAWGRVAEIAEKYLTKGREVCVNGKLSSRSYEDREGRVKYITEVVCSDIYMIGKSA